MWGAARSPQGDQQTHWEPHGLPGLEPSRRPRATPAASWPRVLQDPFPSHLPQPAPRHTPPSSCCPGQTRPHAGPPLPMLAATCLPLWFQRLPVHPQWSLNSAHTQSAPSLGGLLTAPATRRGVARGAFPGTCRLSLLPRHPTRPSHVPCPVPLPTRVPP